ncbi:hypothetical protein IM40_09850 (plasmid) [Candidatus Paracaedimonas acanthamoebae]|nr:hypothetical protein IM40_09850 [Candidatus Paracaedimonas acanthamoebae]
MTKVITLATSKGGAGKTTLARSLACHWYNLGIKVGVIDADPQGSIITRHNPEGLLKDMPIIAQPEETVNDTIEEMKRSCSIILVDTGGFRNRTTIKALIATDIALIPLKPSADDVAGALETYDLIKELNETPERVNNHIKYRMVLTMTQQGTVISRHVREELKSMGYSLLENELYHRVAYPEAAIQGLSPSLTDPESPAARDISRVVGEINNLV